MLVMPVRRSRDSATATIRSRGRSGNIAVAPTSISAMTRTGANAWKTIDPRQSPWKSKTVARVRPQPGHGIPSNCSSGHGQPGNLRLVSPTCKAAAPEIANINLRSRRTGDRTGRKRLCCDIGAATFYSSSPLLPNIFCDRDTHDLRFGGVKALRSSLRAVITSSDSAARST